MMHREVNSQDNGSICAGKIRGFNTKQLQFGIIIIQHDCLGYVLGLGKNSSNWKYLTSETCMALAIFILDG